MAIRSKHLDTKLDGVAVGELWEKLQGEVLAAMDASDIW